MTPLEKTLKRHLAIDGVDYVITLSPQSLKITVKNHRLGIELPWKELVSGEIALAVALHASVGKFAVDPAPAVVEATEKLPVSLKKGEPGTRGKMSRASAGATRAAKARASGKKN